MILGFKTKFRNGSPTQFPEKILAGQRFNIRYDSELLKEFEDAWAVGPYAIIKTHRFMPKWHTIREDVDDRWKTGMDIHFMTGVRTRNAHRFAPIVKVTAVQKIEIVASKSDTTLDKDRYDIAYMTSMGEVVNLGFKVLIDDRVIRPDVINTLAINDGFCHINEFLSWFGFESFKGKIIHWDSVRY